MRFLPTDEQLELQRGVRELLDRRFPLDRLPSGYDDGLWRELTETGVFSLRTELELGLADAALVYEELGRAAVPGPLVGTFLAAGHADGPVTFLESGRTPLLVPHLDAAAALLVFDEDEVQVVRDVTGTLLADPIDPLSPLHELTAMPAGDVVASGPDAGRLWLEGAVLTAALQVGLAARLTELARVAVHAAAVTLDDREATEVSRPVAGAKLLADEAAVTNGRASVQVHGGMGFTWEIPVHFFLKRAWLHATEFGTVDDHAEDLAAAL
jgi:alkylation response protein AidB-like acyl-CoA dehydrogenase